MVKLKKYRSLRKYFVFILTFGVLVACHRNPWTSTRVTGTKIAIAESQPIDSTIDAVIQPYRQHIEKDLSTVLAYNPEPLDKSKGKWQTNIGCFMADVTLEYVNKTLAQRGLAPAAICLLNHGGIRAVIPQGDVTARTAYEVMPFENSVVVLALKGTQISAMVDYLLQEKKPHPLSGLTFTLHDNHAESILVQGIPLDENKVYRVATSDYLSNGGDNMTFFSKALETEQTDYKIRNLLIDYFKATDTIRVNSTPRIIIKE